MCKGFRLDMKFVEDKEGLRALLSQLITKQVELHEKISELNGQVDTLKGDDRKVTDRFISLISKNCMGRR